MMYALKDDDMKDEAKLHNAGNLKTSFQRHQCLMLCGSLLWLLYLLQYKASLHFFHLYQQPLIQFSQQASQ